MNILVEQLEDRFHISWEQPQHPNGDLKYYEV